MKQLKELIRELFNDVLELDLSDKQIDYSANLFIKMFVVGDSIKIGSIELAKEELERIGFTKKLKEHLKE